MRKIYVALMAATALAAATTTHAQKRLITATASGAWSAAATWTTTGTPTIPTDGDSIVIASGVTVSISGNGVNIALSNVIVDIFGTLEFNEPSGTNKTNDLTITTTTSNIAVPIVRLSNSSASITAVSSANGGTGRIVLVQNNNANNKQVKYSTKTVSPNPSAGQTAGPVINGPAFAQNTYNQQPLYFTSGSNAALPVTLSLFKAVINGNSVVLDWNSQAELNTRSFTIERSSNGSNWQQIGVQAASGYASLASKYQFTDASAADINYYRLKITDLDGKISYSSTIVVRLKTGLANVSLFPNPAVNSVNISIGRNMSRQGFTVNILNHNGQLIARHQAAEGTSVLSFDLSHFKTGTYTLDILFTGGARETHKLSIVK